MMYPSTNARPAAISASAAARAVDKSGTLGCPSSAKFVSSKSCAWPAAPLASAAQPGEVLSEVPTTVASAIPPSARTTRRTMRATGSVAPASITPSVSSAARRTWATASAGQSPSDVLTMNSARRAAALMDGTIARLLRVVEDDPQRIARPGGDAADSMAHGPAVDAARALDRTVAGREDDDLTLLGGDRLPPRLRSRSLLHQQEVPAGVVDAASAQEASELERKHDVAVEVLVQAVVAARLVVEQERRRLGLAAPAADRLEAVEGRRMHGRRGQRGLPLVGDGRERRIGRVAQGVDERRHRRGEVLVVAHAELVARHVDGAPEARRIAVEADQLGALGPGQDRRGLRVAPLPQRALDRAPVEAGQARRDVGAGGRAIIVAGRWTRRGGRHFSWRWSPASHIWSSPCSPSASTSSTSITPRSL